MDILADDTNRDVKSLSVMSQTAICRPEFGPQDLRQVKVRRVVRGLRALPTRDFENASMAGMRVQRDRYVGNSLKPSQCFDLGQALGEDQASDPTLQLVGEETGCVKLHACPRPRLELRGDLLRVLAF